MISGKASNLEIYYDPGQGTEDDSNERDIYLFFDIADSTDPTGKTLTQIVCCEMYQPNHRFWDFRENQDLEVSIAPETIKILGEPNLYGALTVREKKSYNQNPISSGPAFKMIKDERRDPSQYITTPGGVSTDHSDRKELEVSTHDSKRYWRSDKKEDQEPINNKFCKNLHLEYFISENDTLFNNKASSRQESILNSSPRANIDRDWNFSSFEVISIKSNTQKESEERSEQLSGINEASPAKNLGYNFEMLKAKILSLSENEEWDLAKEEWMFVHLYKKRYGKCPCNHYPITNHCVIKNQENGNEMFLGNCCIRHISEAQHKRAQKIWQIFRDPKVRANQDLIDHAFSQGYITEHEKNIYEALPKRKRNDIQNKLLLKLNLKIIRSWDAEKTRCERDPSHTIEIHYESSDQALYYKCTQCDYKIKFHERKEDKMEEEFEGHKKIQKKLFDDDILSPESSSEEYDASQDGTFVISQSFHEEEDTSEDEDSLTDESIDEDGEYFPVEYNLQQEEEEEDLNQALTIVKIVNSLRNGEQHSNQQQSNSDKFIYGKDGEATYQ